MAKAPLPEMNIGLVGHVDHGKTTLTAALSGKWVDTHSEELKRGITIKLGYADIDIYKNSKGKLTIESGKSNKLLRRISLIDAPGHETLMAVMISGAAIVDAALLMVSANEPCPQPQTQEHLAALKILGIKKIIVIQNKLDLVTKKDALENYKQITAFLEKNLDFKVPIIPISAQKKVNLDILLEAIQEHLPTPKRDDSKNPEMLIARSFDINKPGTEIKKMSGGVIGGAIVSGKFKIGDKIELRPGIKVEERNQEIWKPVFSEIKSIVVGSNFINEKGPGGSIALATTLDPNLTKGDSLVGNIVGLKGKLPETRNSLELKTDLFEKVIGVKEDIKISKLITREPLMISIGTSTTVGIVSSVGKNNISKLILKRPICAHKGTKVALSRQIGNRWHLIGFGVIQ